MALSSHPPMEYWEFLIQKENESSWQSLKSPEVELQEGKYRLVARSSRPDTEVDIRIIHQSTHENPPKRRLQKRSRRINSEGLMVVIPFTDFKPGIWEFLCRPDLVEDLMGDSWQHSLRLQVLPKDTDRVTKQGGAAAIGEITQSSVPNSQPLTPVSLSKLAISNTSPLLLTLSRETYVAREGQSIDLSGQVELPATFNDETSNSPVKFNGELIIRLRDPQNGQLLADRQQVFSAQQIPFTFSCKINFPNSRQTHLILGEITLYNAKETPADTPLVLATKSFSITADLDDLLSAIADDFSEGDLLELPSEKSQSATLDLSAYNQATTPKSLNLQTFQPSTGLVLPPQIYQPDPTKPVSKKIQLPSFGNTSVPIPAPLPESADTESNQTEEQSENLESEDSASVKSSEDSNLEEITEAPATDEADIDPYVVETAFQSLKLEDRFWSRLNAIAGDAELSAELSSDPLFEEEEIGDRTSRDAYTYTGPDAEFIAQEIVVEDEPEAPQPKQEIPPSPITTYSPTQIDDEPLPTPELDVPKGELIAGQQIRVRVKVPMRQPRLGVKFWVVDLQTRSLVEGPRWLGDFFPDAWGNVETAIQMNVPLGCLSIRFEAIATEIQSKRESRKAQVDRAVIPPDLPEFSQDELDVL